MPRAVPSVAPILVFGMSRIDPHDGVATQNGEHRHQVNEAPAPMEESIGHHHAPRTTMPPRAPPTPTPPPCGALLGAVSHSKPPPMVAAAPSPKTAVATLPFRMALSRRSSPGWSHPPLASQK